MKEGLKKLQKSFKAVILNSMFFNFFAGMLFCMLLENLNTTEYKGIIILFIFFVVFSLIFVNKKVNEILNEQFEIEISHVELAEECMERFKKAMEDIYEINERGMEQSD